MPHKPDYLEPLPGKSVSQPFLDTLKQQARYGGAVDATSNLAAGAKLAQGMGAAGSAFAGLGGQRFGPKLPGTETLEVGPEVGGRGGLTVAQVILAVPEKKLPSWFRALLKSTPESQLPNVMRQSWEKLVDGHRDVFKNKGVIGKIDNPPELDSFGVEGARDFLKAAELRKSGNRGELFRGPEPLAYSTETNTAFFRNAPHMSRVPDSPENQKLMDRATTRRGEKQIWDGATLNSGPENMYLHNWGIMDKPKTGKPFGVGYDLGLSGNVPIPTQFYEAAKLSPNMQRTVDRLENFGQHDPSIDKFFEVLKKSKR